MKVKKARKKGKTSSQKATTKEGAQHLPKIKSGGLSLYKISQTIFNHRSRK
jgi:hypothetical protein